MQDLKIQGNGPFFQITAEGSACFLVTVMNPKASSSCLIFSEFKLCRDDTAQAVKALHLVDRYVHKITPKMKLVFQQVHPPYLCKVDKVELVRKHDQLVCVLEDYASQANLQIGNSVLDLKRGEFETVIFLI